jgi:hypothetical protein
MPFEFLLEFLLALFDIHELNAILLSFGPRCLANQLAFKLRALANCALPGVSPGGRCEPCRLSPEQRQQQDDGKRNADKPKQQAASERHASLHVSKKSATTRD